MLERWPSGGAGGACTAQARAHRKLAGELAEERAANEARPDDAEADGDRLWGGVQGRKHTMASVRAFFRPVQQEKIVQRALQRY